MADFMRVITLSSSIGKRNVTVWRSSVCPSVYLFCQHTHRYSPGGSIRRGQRTFRSDDVFQ